MGKAQAFMSGLPRTDQTGQNCTAAYSVPRVDSQRSTDGQAVIGQGFPRFSTDWSLLVGIARSTTGSSQCPTVANRYTTGQSVRYHEEYPTVWYGLFNISKTVRNGTAVGGPVGVPRVYICRWPVGVPRVYICR